jgi:hypothetical protein
MGKHTQSIEKQVLSRIQRSGVGQVFAPRQFLDLGSREAVDQALSRHARAGTLRKVARGLYELPRVHTRLGSVPASTEAIAEAIKGRDAVRLQSAGAHAANILGLSEQVPVRAVYLTDGRSRRVKVGKREILLKHTTPRNMATAGRPSGMVIQALRWIGRKQVDDKLIARLRRNHRPEDRAALVKDAHLAPAWIAAIFRQLAQEAK